MISKEGVDYGYTIRSAVEYCLPLENSIRILRPEYAFLNFEPRRMDVGALCYRLRKKTHASEKNGVVRRVKEESLDKARRRRIMVLIRYLSNAISVGLTKAVTLYGSTGSFVRFIDWCDENKRYEVLYTIKEAKNGIRGYTRYLEECVRKNTLSKNTAQRYQAQALVILSEIMECDFLNEGLRLIKRSVLDTKNTKIPDDVEQGKVLSLCEALFSGFSDLVLEKKLYPYRLSVPSYIGATENIIWIFPIKLYLSHHRLHGINLDETVSYWAYDFDNGCVNAIENIQHFYKLRCSAETAIHRALHNIDAANRDYNHSNRKRMSMVAHNSFFLLFLANTAMNYSQAKSLSWNDKYTVGLDGQGFRVIKWRANNKEQDFRIELSFLSNFKRYLSLRAYLIGDNSTYNYLFFTLGKDSNSQPRMIGSNVLRSLFKTIRNICPSLNKILSRQWRVAKSDWLIRNADISTAAMSLQNSEDTILKKYSNGSEVRGVEEMGRFLSNLNDVVKKRKTKSTKAETGCFVGHCSQYGVPHKIIDTEIEPDCHQPEGCLFCNKYSLHADYTDVRKLLSCLYCINITSHLSSSVEHHESIFGVVKDRINELLTIVSDISKKNKAMVDQVREEVEQDGDLDPYWSGKYQQLVFLGVVKP